jgi:hypothetical protein
VKQPEFAKARKDRLKSNPKPKLKYNGLVFHGLRRTFISDAEHAGLPRREAMKLERRQNRKRLQTLRD